MLLMAFLDALEHSPSVYGPVAADCRCPEPASNVATVTEKLMCCFFCLVLLNSWFIGETEASFILMIMW
jgi:hypothetical protein